MKKDYRTKWQKLAVYLLPCEPLPDDKAFILAYLPRNKGFRLTALNGYKDKWLLCMRLEDVDHKKQNAGRRGANRWLRTTYTKLREIEKYG